MRKFLTVARAAAATLFVATLAAHPAVAGPGANQKQTVEAETGEAAAKPFGGAFAAFGRRMAVPAAGQTGRSRFEGMIARQAAANGVPLALAHAVIRIESNYRPNARGSAGEVGLMQIKPSTARGLGYSGSAKALYDPETNLRWGMKYLGQAHRLGGGEICGTILKYNAGHGARRMNRHSSAYCAKVKRQMASNRAP